MGFGEVFPIGYRSTVETHGYDSIAVINKKLHNIDQNNPDIIITGTQAETVAAGIACIENIPYEQNYFLYGINSDGYVLVYNYFDDLSYIQRTVKYAEAINGTKVIAIVIFPVDNDLRWSVLGNKRLIVDEEKINKKKREIEQSCEKKTYVLGDEADMLHLFKNILKYFQE